LIDSSVNEERWRRPSPSLRGLRHLEVAAPGVVGLIAAAVVAVASPVAGAAVAGCVVAAGALADWLLQRRVRAWAYLEREDDLLVRRGILVRRLSVVPYGRMQFVDVTAGPLERAFGLATVRLHTAAAATDARIPGLDVREASRLRDQLARIGEARAAGL
jgi:membrane protein YdbS with pleckstrin-like domain